MVNALVARIHRLTKFLKHPLHIILLLLCLALLIISPLVLAQTGDFTLSWWTVEGGGGHSAGGQYNVSGTLGQPDAAQTSRGGRYSLQGGYTALSPRQALTAAPYALHARSADNSLGALQCNIDQIARFDGARWICSNSTDAGLQARVAELENDVAALQELLVHLSREGDDLYLTGANLHVVNGTGTTDSKPNSLGNVIIGYNEERTNGTNIRSGSHMLVVGKEHNYATFGGIVAGFRNETTGAYASVSGGRQNKAGGEYASVSGGGFNMANGKYASVSGGANSTAAGTAASVSGGFNNTTTFIYASVSGGVSNKAAGTAASVSGGLNRTVGGSYDWRAGGLFEDQ